MPGSEASCKVDFFLKYHIVQLGLEGVLRVQPLKGINTVRVPAVTHTTKMLINRSNNGTRCKSHERRMFGLEMR